MPEPLVSFLLPVYNGAAFLREALESLGRQTEGNFEIVAIDDGSSDASWDILTSFPDARLRPIRHPVNRGLANTLNHCMEAARGRFFARMDADDFSLPRRLELQLAHLQKNSTHGLCGSAVRVVGNSQHRPVWKYPECPKHVEACLIFSSPCAHPTFLIRREVFEAGFLYDPRHELAEDWDFLDRVSAQWPISNLSEALLDYRLSADGISRARASGHLRAKKQMAARILNRIGIDADENVLDLHLEITDPKKRSAQELKRISSHMNRVFRAASRDNLANPYLILEIVWRWIHLCRAAGPAGWIKLFLQCPLI